ncbi:MULTISPECIES: hypothetical protein [unclassified Brevibacterium]|uniref:hypothetical protein n=1 Tax=unclassified Brevibacterium TaxID=2614124 RepID=UPI0010929EFD|nr:hypothetical protein [Brevibacterium sp. S22]
MNIIPRISKTQSDLLGNYVYVYYDTETEEPFYIGRGRGNRVLSHAKSSHNDLVRDRIEREKYDFDILAYGLDDETAKKVEAAAIDLIGIDNLLNKSRGSGATKYGRVNVRTLLRSIASEDITEVHHNLIVVSIKQTYEQYGDDIQALHESTRGVWWGISSEKADQAEYVVGVVEGRVVYVMTVAAWLPAGSTEYFVRGDNTVEGRIEFVGRTASEDIQDLYLGRRIRAGESPMYYGPFHDKVFLVDSEWRAEE